MVERQVVAYEPNFDRALYQQSKEKNNLKLNEYAKRQLETHLGERFNVLLSTTHYEIKNGQIYSKDLEEPFINSLIRGRDYRRKNGNPVDFLREDAEVEGFSKIESELISDDVKAGDMMLSVSPPGGEGSIYKHNFYDIFTLKESENGKFIEAKRYSSGLTLDETTKRLKESGILDLDKNPTAEDYLSSPIKITPFEALKTSDDLHKLLHKEHEYTDNEDFENAKRAIASLIVSYVKSLSENPYSIYEHNLRLNTALNGMDHAMELVRRSKKTSQFVFPEIFEDKMFIQMLSKSPVRQVMTGCGASGGFETKATNDLMDSPFSLANKDPKKSSEKQILCCTCPFCNREVEAEIGGGKITCPNCRKSASWN